MIAAVCCGLLGFRTLVARVRLAAGTVTMPSVVNERMPSHQSELVPACRFAAMAMRALMASVRPRQQRSMHTSRSMPTHMPCGSSI